MRIYELIIDMPAIIKIIPNGQPFEQSPLTPFTEINLGIKDLNFKNIQK